MLIPAYNPPLDDLEETFLLNPESAGTTSHTVKNNTNFATNDRILIGKQGSEKAEIVTVTSVSGANTIVTSTTSLAHDADDSIIRLRYDQVRYYLSTTGSGGTYNALATVNLDVNQEGLITTYDHTTGVATNFYKVDYYNSVTTLASALSDPLPGGGYTRNSVGFTIDEIIREVRDANLTRTQILNWMNDCSDDLQTKNKRPYRFLGARTTLSRVAGQNYIDLPTDATTGLQIVWKYERTDYNFVDSTNNTNVIYPLRVISLPEFRESYQDQTVSATTEDDQTQVVALDETMNRLRIYPTPKTSSPGVYYLYYWSFFSELNSEGDTFQTPTPRVYKLYVLFRYYLQKSATDLGFLQLSTQFQNLYTAEVIKLKKSDNRDQGSPLGFKFLPQDYKGNRGF